VATRAQVRKLLDEGLGYRGAAHVLGIPAGQAYMIATGRPADGSDTPPSQEARRGGLLASRLLPASQHLSNPPPENPASSQTVRDWIARRAAADNQMQAASRQRNAEPGEPSDPEHNLDATVVLTRQHNQVRTLQQQLEAIPSRTGGTASDFERRKSIVDMITMHLSRHETAEEEHFWPAVRSVLPDGDEWANTALEQEQEGKDLLTALGRLAGDTDEFDEHVEKLVLVLRQHVAHEEQVFLRLREAMPHEEREKLGRKLLKASKRAPARPHRHAPKEPGAAVKAAAPGAAAADKLRDAAGNRPAKRKGTAE
jgi:hemerythrin superfamily protein